MIESAGRKGTRRTNGKWPATLLVVLSFGCGEAKAPIFEDDSAAIRALKESGADVLRLPIPGGMTAEEVSVQVDLSDVSIDSEIMSNVNAIPNVRELMLTGSHIDDETLAQLEGTKALNSLDLTGSNVTNAGLENLSSKEFPGLLVLVLDKTRVTGEGLVHVPPSVTGLSVANLAVNDDNLKNLGHLKRLNALTLTGTQVTAAGVKEFKKDRPNLLVMGIRLK